MAKLSSKKVVLVYTLANKIWDHFLHTVSDSEYQWIFCPLHLFVTFGNIQIFMWLTTLELAKFFP